MSRLLSISSPTSSITSGHSADDGTSIAHTLAATLTAVPSSLPASTALNTNTKVLPPASTINSCTIKKRRQTFIHNLGNVKSVTYVNSDCSTNSLLAVPLHASSIHEAREKFLSTSTASTVNDDKVVFFDMDNTLYHHSFGIHDMMAKRIKQYCVERLGMDPTTAHDLMFKYYLEYGLAIRGLMKHHEVCPKDYDDFVDGGLPLHECLYPDLQLNGMIDAIKGRKWVFTNAGINHAIRVLDLLHLTSHFEGILYCDYAIDDFQCKPEKSVYHYCQELFASGPNRQQPLSPQNCYFIDDNAKNVVVAKELGWNAVYLKTTSKVRQPVLTVDSIMDLPRVFPELF